VFKTETESIKNDVTNLLIKQETDNTYNRYIFDFMALFYRIVLVGVFTWVRSIENNRLRM